MQMLLKLKYSITGNLDRKSPTCPECFSCCSEERYSEEPPPDGSLRRRPERLPSKDYIFKHVRSSVDDNVIPPCREFTVWCPAIAIVDVFFCLAGLLQNNLWPIIMPVIALAQICIPSITAHLSPNECAMCPFFQLLGCLLVEEQIVDAHHAIVRSDGRNWISGHVMQAFVCLKIRWHTPDWAICSWNQKRFCETNGCRWRCAIEEPSTLQCPPGNYYDQHTST